MGQKEALIILDEGAICRTVAVKYRFASGEAHLEWIDPSCKLQDENLYMRKVL
ncbi:hypothetical protein [uncultured Ruegeria sp.]|uniref:hypothetical protein n=1 Tax=uncultured Ruegeria sp. TaxID=259304 RepID=UPI0026032A04|nr:hypothetical protein [uncultured Ruegeria sp.]